MCYKPVWPSFQLILELCHKQPDEEAIMSHLERIRIPAAMSASGHIKVVFQEITPAHLKILVQTDDKARAQFMLFSVLEEGCKDSQDGGKFPFPGSHVAIGCG